MRTYINLSEALYETFKSVIGSEEECKLHEDVFIKRKLRETIGVKEFNRFDALDEKYWNESWREFDIIVFEGR
ncbi:hypothetical protein [Paenibacillus sp. FSL H3-0333]|uniref:hypothetical protein n=1 Tax=Paenibacillus sp. FSL H3-0333 TaxID=2921373 RepID=UPI0030FC1509